MREKTYGKDDVIFREGDAADCVYVVVNGRVEMSKQGRDGPVTLATLGPLELFGEMGPLDASPRSATARAVEKSRVKIIAKDEFRTWLLEEPDAAMRVINTLIERLRAADETIAKLASGAQMVARQDTRPVGLISAFIGLFQRLRAQNANNGPSGEQPFIIGIATVNNDIEGAWTRALMGLLDGRPGVVARMLPLSLAIEPGADQVQAAAAVARARQVLVREDVIDVLVWGDVHEDGFSLWFTAAGAVDDDRPGSLGPFFSLELAGDLEAPVGELFNLAVLTAIEPLNEVQRLLLRQLLPAALPSLPAFPAGLPVTWNMDQQRTALICYGHALASAASWDGDLYLFDRAAESYRAAVLRLPQGGHGIDEAILRKHLGGVLMATGDRRQDIPLLEQAVAEFRTAVEGLFKGAYPLEWAGGQNRLGQALYKLDLLTGQAELLRDALAAFQAALTVFTRAEAPLRWADVMNNLAQVLQVYGDQVKSPEVLARAVEACRASLELRSRDRGPLAWASSQNTLGTALFLLDKHSQTTEHLDEAEAAYTSALEVYRAVGASRQAAVTEKNLAHVDKLNKIRGVRKVALPDWSSEE